MYGDWTPAPHMRPVARAGRRSRAAHKKTVRPDASRKQSSNDSGQWLRRSDRKRKVVSDIPVSEMFETPAEKKMKVQKHEPNIPKIAHIVWLNKQANGQIPQKRFENVLSLSKQLKAQGWHVKIWVNSPMILHRADTMMGLDKESPISGLDLEPGLFSTSTASSSQGKIEVCLDKELFEDMSSVDKAYYESRQEELGLPILWTPYSEEPMECTDTKEPSRSLPQRGQPDLSVSGSDDSDLEHMELASSPASEAENESMETDSAFGGEDEELVKKKKVVDRRPFRKNLLDLYLLNQVGERNYATASDFLRFAALKKYGGVYLDSDTEAGHFKDGYKPEFHALYAPHGVLAVHGEEWKTDYGNDMFASVPQAPELDYLQLDQFYHCSMLDQLPYTLWAINEDEVWTKRGVSYSGSGLELTPGKNGQITAGVGNKGQVSLSDAARSRVGIYQALKGREEIDCGEQEGLTVGPDGLVVNERNKSLRFSLTLYSSGPCAIARMMDKYHGDVYWEASFKNLTRARLEKFKNLDDKVLMGATKWGGLSRLATISWDKPTEPKQKRQIQSHDDKEVEDISSAMRSSEQYQTPPDSLIVSIPIENPDGMSS